MPHWVRLQFLRRHLELPDDSQSISLLHRLSIIYLSLPLAIWLLGWFHWWFGVLAVALLVAALWAFLATLGRSEYAAVREWMERRRARRAQPTESRRQRRRRMREEHSDPANTTTGFNPAFITIPVILVVAAIWVMLSGAGGYADVANADWNKHRGVFSALGTLSWPAYLPTRDELPDPILRYYLGYYMVPGLLAKVFGEQALTWAIGLWTWAGASLALLLFTRHFTRWAVLAAATVFILFSGMDALRWIFHGGLEIFGYSTLEWNNSDIDMQYTAITTGLIYVPQHLIPAVIATMLFIQLWRDQALVAASGVIVVITAFWSPFVALGLLPIAALIALHQGVRPFLSWQNLACALPLAALLATYLLSGFGAIERGWLWQRHEWSELASFVPLFLLAEFLILAALLWLLSPALRRNGLFIVSLAVMVLLPLYTYGIFNDLLMRVSLPAVVIVCLCAATILVSNGSNIKRLTLRQGALTALVILVLAIGAVTPYVEVRRSVIQWSDYHFPWGEIEPSPTDAFATISDEIFRLYSGRPPEQFQALLRQ